MHRDSFTEDYEFFVEKDKEGGYSVSLPHQCDDWEIIGADIGNIRSGDKIDLKIMTDDYPNLPKDKKLAVKQMKLFIKRATKALKKLDELK